MITQLDQIRRNCVFKNVTNNKKIKEREKENQCIDSNFIKMFWNNNAK